MNTVWVLLVPAETEETEREQVDQPEEAVDVDRCRHR